MLGAKHTTIGCMEASASGALDRGVIRDVAAVCLQSWNQKQGDDRSVDGAVWHEIYSGQSRDEKTTTAAAPLMEVTRRTFSKPTY